MSGPGWLQALIDEMVDLHSNDIWDWFLYPMEKLKWVVDGSIQLKLAMMEILVRLFFALVAPSTRHQKCFPTW